LLPEGLTTIHGEALAGCTNLTEITIPASVKIIKDDVFMGCELLTAIHWQENTYATVEEFLTAFEAAGQSGMTNKEVRSLYDRAVQVMGWFQLMPLGHDGEKTVTVNDMTYYQVTDENVKSMEDLKAAVYGIFDPELANGLLEPEGNPAPYIEMNDKLYVLPADRGTDLYKGQEELSWTYESTESITVTVRVEDLDVDLTTVKGYSRHTFTLERAEGAWVFTRFELVR